MTKNENKTKPTSQDVVDFLASIDAEQQADAQVLVQIMQEVTGEDPVMWGSSIIGFGSYHYKSKSGREGDWMRIGFAPRKNQLSLYITMDAAQLKIDLDAMGKYKTGKGCIYIRTLEDVDNAKLKEIIEMAYTQGNPYEL